MANIESIDDFKIDDNTKERLERALINQDGDIIAPSQVEEKILDELTQKLNPNDRNSIIYYGVEAQEKLDEISNKMIDGVKNKDIGEAGEALNRMVSAIKGFDVDSLNPNKKLAWWERILGKSEPLANFMQKYEEIRDQLDIIAQDLERHRFKLTKDIVALDKLYEANLDYFRKLELYIKAGEKKLKELDEQIIPQYEQKAQSGDMIDAQNLKEIRGFRDDLERRVHDLRLSRQVALQALPSIRLIQENDKSLINKISSTLVNTVPLWRNQLAQTITIYRSHDAAKAVKGATDLTNELLQKNAQALRDANKEVRTQMERGLFDIESIKRANDTLIATLNDSLKIANEGKKAREVAVVELQKAEEKLKEALITLKAKEESSTPKSIEE